MDILIGTEHVKLTTKNEILLAIALKSVLFEHGQPPSTNDCYREFNMHRFSFIDSVRHRLGTVQLCEDALNGRDMVRLIK